MVFETFEDEIQGEYFSAYDSSTYIYIEREN